MQNCTRGASNRELMRVFRDVVLVESLGTGMQRIMRKYTKDNFEFGDNYIRMVVPYNWVDVQEKVTGKATGKATGKVTGKVTEKVTGKVTEKTSDKILRLITANPSITISRMMVALSMSDSGIRKVLRNLQAQGAIRRVGSDKTGHWEIIEK